jgi:hypothetical protein
LSVDLKTHENKNRFKLFSDAEFRPYSDIQKLAPDISKLIDRWPSRVSTL